MIAGSDRVSLFEAIRGGEPVQLRFDSPDDASAPEAFGIVGALRQSRRFSPFSRRLCCERAYARLTMTVLLRPVFFVIFIALVLAVFLESSRG
jgi:hypothetical protein